MKIKMMLLLGFVLCAGGCRGLNRLSGGEQQASTGAYQVTPPTAPASFEKTYFGRLEGPTYFVKVPEGINGATVEVYARVNADHDWIKMQDYVVGSGNPSYMFYSTPTLGPIVQYRYLESLYNGMKASDIRLEYYIYLCK